MPAPTFPGPKTSDRISIKPTVTSFRASPLRYCAGLHQLVTVTWSTTGTAEVRITGTHGQTTGSLPASGSTQIPLVCSVSAETFTLTATGHNGTRTTAVATTDLR